MVIPRHHITPFYMYLCRRYYIGSCWDLFYDVLNGLELIFTFWKDISLDEFVFYDKANITGKNLVTVLYKFRAIYLYPILCEYLSKSLHFSNHISLNRISTRKYVF